jgi:hypothetical protein
MNIKSALKNWTLLVKIASLLLLSFCALGLVIGLTVRHNLLNSELQALVSLSARAKNDLIYSDGKWNTAKYNADPNTPHPQGSSGFASSLYIITTDGFVIERTQPVNGILDSADFKHLVTFQTPQTISIVTNEQWRVLSQPITNENGTVVGVIMVSYFNPQPLLLQTIDQKLQRNIAYITSSMVVKNDVMDVSKVDIRDVDYDVTFEIVNHFNRVLLNGGRVPTYIDSSYIEQELAKPEGASQVTDDENHKSYLLYRQQLTDSANRPVGIIVSGKSIDYITALLLSLIFPAVIAGLAAVITLTILLYRFLAYAVSPKKHEEEPVLESPPAAIEFDTQNSVIHLDGKTIQIPYATNQYELAKAVFSAPTKRWELDELLELFGETENLGNWRKVYDATLALNKKAGLKIVVYKDKTFRLNPELVPLVKKN